MAQPQPDTIEFLLQLDVIDEQLRPIGKEQWQTLYFRGDDHPHHLGMWCALLNDDAAANAVSHDSWDLMIGDGKPGFSQSRSGTEDVTS